MKNNSVHGERSALRKESGEEGGPGRFCLWHNSKKAQISKRSGAKVIPQKNHTSHRNGPEQGPHVSQFWTLKRPRKTQFLCKQSHESSWGAQSALLPAVQDVNSAFLASRDMKHHFLPLLTFTNNSKIDFLFISIGEILLLSSLLFLCFLTTCKMFTSPPGSQCTPKSACFDL